MIKDWDGQGLPPIGTICLGQVVEKGKSWLPCKVVYQDLISEEYFLVLFAHEYDKSRFTQPVWCCDFLMMRTDASIKREAVMSFALEALGYNSREFYLADEQPVIKGAHPPYDIVEELYEAGALIWPLPQAPLPL
jgi:hypothetical protein